MHQAKDTGAAARAITNHPSTEVEELGPSKQPTSRVNPLTKSVFTLLKIQSATDQGLSFNPDELPMRDEK